MELVKYEAAKFALAEAKSTDEVKNIHDVSAAMKAYAKQAKDKQLELDASEIRIRAERRLGEMIRQQKKEVGLNVGGNPNLTSNSKEPVEGARPTLSDAGITKKLSSRSQAIAAIPEDEFEEVMDEHRENQKAVTSATMEKLGRKSKPTKKVKPKEVIHSDAANYVDYALLQLERINPKDPNLEKELSRLNKWINTNLRKQN